MCAVGGDEIDQRLRMPQVLHQVDPAGVGLELAVLGHVEELTARRVQGRNAGIAATGNIDGRQVERQANQVVAQGFSHELVELVADLARRTAHDGARRSLWGNAAGCKLERVEKGRDQAGLLIASQGRITVAHDIETGVETVHRLGQHGVAEAIHGMRKLGDDGRIDRGVESVRGQEGVDIRLDLAREFLEYQVLILHLGAELGGLEQALAVPHQVCNGRPGWNDNDRDVEPLIEESDIVRGKGHLFGLLNQPVVLGVEYVVHRGQADVFIDAAIAGDVVGVEQLVVVPGVVSRGTDRNGVADRGVNVRLKYTADQDRHGVVCDVVKEGVASAHGVSQADAESAIGCRVALDEGCYVVRGSRYPVCAVTGAYHYLRATVRGFEEVAIGVGSEQRHVVEVGIGEVDAQHIARLCLHDFPGGHAAEFCVGVGSDAAETSIGTQITIGDQLAGGERRQIYPRTDNRIAQLIGAQEHLV